MQQQHVGCFARVICTPFFSDDTEICILFLNVSICIRPFHALNSMFILRIFMQILTVRTNEIYFSKSLTIFVKKKENIVVQTIRLQQYFEQFLDLF
jgi:hypothetical protein